MKALSGPMYNVTLNLASALLKYVIPPLAALELEEASHPAPVERLNF